MQQTTTYYTTAQIIELFKQHKSWEDKYRQILQLAKALPAMDGQYQNEQYQVKGCESDVWLVYQLNQETKQYTFSATSNARIVRGLLMIILAAYQNATAEQIKRFDIEAYFAQLDLLKHLSPSRANGIHAIIMQIKQLSD